MVILSVVTRTMGVRFPLLQPISTLFIRMQISVKRNGTAVSTMDLKKLHNGDIEIEYMNTLPEYRNQGFASLLLNKAKRIAEKSNTILVAFVEPNKSGGLTFQQETEWLERNGFKHLKRYDFGGYFKPVMIYHK